MDVSNTTQAAMASTIRQDARLRLRAGGDDAAQRLALRERSVARESASVAGRESVERPDVGSPDSLRTAVREAIDYQRTERTMLRLRTQEGDVVRLRFVAADSVSARYREDNDGERSVSEFQVNAESRTRMKLMVEGDLDADEMRAIEEVVAQAREMASAFYAGDVAAAFDTASEFQMDGEQLARVNLRFSVQERMRLAQSVTTTQAVPDAPQPDAVAQANTQPAPSAIPAAAAPAPSVDPASVAAAPTGDTQVAPPAAPAPSSVPAAPVETSPATAPIGTADQPLARLTEALTAITDFLTGLTEMLEDFSARVGGDVQAETMSYSFSYGFKLQMVSAMVSAIEQPASGDAEGEEGRALAVATIDELAAQQEATLDVSV